MGDLVLLALVIGALGFLTAIIMAYKFLPKFRFWCFDIWADLPLIGTVARRSRMRRPTTERANARLDELFHGYLLHMPTPIEEEDFNRIRAYLFHACDSQSKPTPVMAWVLLFALICAESYAFSFLLGVSLSGDMSQNRADLVAVGIAFILGLVLLILAHMSGHQIRRTHELRSAHRHSIDTSGDWRADEKPIKDLTQRISLEDDQNLDEPQLENYDSQRFINRAAKSVSDHGSYVMPVLFIISVILIGLGQFQLRNIMADAEALGPVNSAPEWANALFVLIFFMTQGLALMFGYKYGFMGQDSKRGYDIIDGRNDFHSYTQERDPMVRRADESLSSLYSKMRSRYSKIRPDNISFLARLHAEEQASPLPTSPDDEPEPALAEAEEPTPDPSNVMPIDRDNAR